MACRGVAVKMMLFENPICYMGWLRRTHRPKLGPVMIPQQRLFFLEFLAVSPGMPKPGCGQQWALQPISLAL